MMGDVILGVRVYVPVMPFSLELSENLPIWSASRCQRGYLTALRVFPFPFQRADKAPLTFVVASLGYCFPTVITAIFQIGGDLSGPPLVTAQTKRNIEKMTFLALWQDESGQDLIEYTLLLAFCGLGLRRALHRSRQQRAGIWSVVNSQLAAANTSAS